MSPTLQSSSSLLVVALLSLTTATTGFAPASVRTRSSTISTRTERHLLPDPGHAIGSFYEHEPYLAAFLTCSIKGSAADFVAQRSATTHNNGDGDNNKFDAARNLAFILYGGLYQGIGQSFLFSQVYPHLFGTEHALTTVASQVMTDLFLVGPFFCLPTAYTIKASLSRSEGDVPTNPLDLPTNMAAAVDKYMDDVMDKKLLWKYWALWIPVQSLTFGVVPTHLRVPFVAMVSFFWVMLLSSLSSSSSEEATATLPIKNYSPQVLLPTTSSLVLPMMLVKHNQATSAAVRSTSFVPPSAWPEKHMATSTSS